MKKYIIVRDNAQYIAGTTLKAASQPEAFNMALHVCKSEEAVLINRARFAKDLNIDLQSIKKYVETSKTFNDLRHNYELEIVRWEIDWIIAGGENWRMPKGYSELDFLFNPDVDKIFRNSVLTTLLSIGMDREVIEEGIEKYSDLWREKYIVGSLLKVG